jgi:hypothetical protein
MIRNYVQDIFFHSDAMLTLKMSKQLVAGEMNGLYILPNLPER